MWCGMRILGSEEDTEYTKCRPRIRVAGKCRRPASPDAASSTVAFLRRRVVAARGRAGLSRRERCVR
jgi:hypothetical protein